MTLKIQTKSHKEDRSCEKLVGFTDVSARCLKGLEDQGKVSRKNLIRIWSDCRSPLCVTLESGEDIEAHRINTNGLGSFELELTSSESGNTRGVDFQEIRMVTVAK